MNNGNRRSIKNNRRAGSVKRLKPAAGAKTNSKQKLNKNNGGGGCCGCKKKKNIVSKISNKSMLSTKSSKSSKSSLLKRNASAKKLGPNQIVKRNASIAKAKSSTIIPTTISVTKPPIITPAKLVSDKSSSARKKRAVKTPPNRTSGTQQSPEESNRNTKKPEKQTDKAAEKQSDKTAEKPTEKAPEKPVEKESTPKNEQSLPQISIPSEKPSEKNSEKPSEQSVVEVKAKRLRPIQHVKAIENQKLFQDIKFTTAECGNGMMERKILITQFYPIGKPPKIYDNRLSIKAPVQLPFNVPSKSAVSPTTAFSSTQQASVTSAYTSGASRTTASTKTSSYTTLDKANSTEKSPNIELSPEKSINTESKRETTKSSRCKKQQKSLRDRAISTIKQLRGHYQLTHDEVRLLSKNPDLKVITIRAGLALQEAQRNLRNLKVLAGSHLLPDLALFNDELSAVLLELDRFMDTMHTVSEHANSPAASIRQ